jgi:16S rRNA (cytosine967-C5)-methyltransferase
MRSAVTLVPRDRAFVRLLLATTLRRLGEIDGVLGELIERPIDDASIAAIHVLRLGAAQLLFLGTPPHAAVDTSVRMVEQVHLAHLKGLVNAVLRRISREGAALLGERDPAHLNTPAWLWESWTASYGDDTARAIAAAHLIEAPLDITPRSSAETWASELQAEILPTGTLRRTAGGYIADLPGFAEGAWWVQDAAATIPARLMGDVSGKRVADLCAAPGGKTMQLCAAGAAVTAVDVSGRRMVRLGENLTRSGLSAELVTSDVSKWKTSEKFDAVLLDAPCSGTGTLRRHPDIAWLKGEEDIARLILTQDRLLLRAVELLAPGGTLIYAVCSLQEVEGPMRIEHLLERRPQLKRVPVRPEELPGLEEAITPAGDVRTLPSMWAERGGIDGFYVARLTA